ncbi:hypothetical protein DRQ12_12690, partial [candidate division KSB1 bacterium]
MSVRIFSQLSRYVFIFLFCLLFSPRAYSHNAGLGTKDSICCISRSNYLVSGSAISINRKIIWCISKNKKLYKWNGTFFEDASSPNENYEAIFALDSDDIWLHIYQKNNYRYFFRRYYKNKSAEYNDPDNFYLNDFWWNASDDIWACGILGTLLHFDGGQWSKYPSPTNGHIWGICLGKDRDGWIVLENELGGTELYQISLETNRLKALNRCFEIIGLLPKGIWAVISDSLVFISNNNSRMSFPFDNQNLQSNLIPMQDNTIFNLKMGFWFAFSENQPTYLLMLCSQGLALKLHDGGKIDTLKVTFAPQSSLLQFLNIRLNQDKEYSAGCGFLDDDKYLDILVIVPEEKNRLYLGKRLGDSFILQDCTIDFKVAESQLTSATERYYDNGILIADFDNDNDQDLLIIAHQGSNLYFENNHRRSFTNRTSYAHL